MSERPENRAACAKCGGTPVTHGYSHRYYCAVCAEKKATPPFTGDRAMTESEFLEAEKRREEHDFWRGHVWQVKRDLDNARELRLTASRRIEKLELELKKLLAEEPK